MIPVICHCCGDSTKIEDHTCEPICDECFEIRESSQGMPDECYSDADPGL